MVETLIACAPRETQCFFYRSSGGAEIDLLLLWPDGKTWAIEIKRSLAPFVRRGFHSACADVRPTRKLVVYPGRDAFRIADDIEAMPLAPLARELAG